MQPWEAKLLEQEDLGLNVSSSGYVGPLPQSVTYWMLPEVLIYSFNWYVL